MMRGVSMLFVLLLSGCPDAETGGGGDDPIDRGVVDLGPDEGPQPGPCDDVTLAAQCPVGSAPRVIVDGCVDGAAVTADDGSVTGICARAGECLFVCDFADPCPCGIDSISVDAIVCTDCADAAACGDAICDGGENPDTCAVDCGARCVPQNERCDGNARQECEDTGRWATLACRADQICQFGPTADTVVTICQTRISMGGGSFPGFGDAMRASQSSRDIRFRQISFDGEAVRFVDDGARVLVVRGDQLVIIDPSGDQPDQPTTLNAGVAPVASASRAARASQGSRWPQVGEIFDATSRTVEVMVHDGADVRAGAMALSEDDARFAAAFAVGLKGSGRLEPVLGIWSAVDGQLDRLLRFVDADVVDSQAPATAVALSLDGAVALEARPGGVVIVWNVEERRFAYLLQTDVGEVTHLVPSTMGDDQLVVGGNSGVALWQFEGANNPRRVWRRAINGVTAAALAPDSSVIAVGAGSQVELLDPADGSTLNTFMGRTRFIDFDPAGGRLLFNDVIYSSEL